MSLFSRIVLDAAVIGPARRAPGRTLLSVLAICLGVALGFAIHLINRAAADEVSVAARSLFGLADLAVEGSGEGFDEGVYAQLVGLPGVALASPEVEVLARIDTGADAGLAMLKLLGVDVFRARQLQPALANVMQSGAGATLGLLGERTLYLSAAAARELGLGPGDELAVQTGLRKVRFEIAGILPEAGTQERLAMLDIGTAQWRFERLGKLSRINLRLRPGADLARTRAQIAALLPANARVVTPGASTDEAVRLSRAYRGNLTALALVALFTGGFLVYSTQSIAVLRRFRELAILHALGVTRREQAILILLGGVTLGILGAIPGVLLGHAVAGWGLDSLGGDLGAGYFRGMTPELRVHPLEWLAFGALATAAAVAGTLKPALDAARTPTATALRAGDVGGRAVRTHRGLTLAMLLVSLALLPVPPIGGLPLAGYAAIATLTMATVMAMPWLTATLLRRLPTLRSAPYEVALAHLRGTTRFTSLSLSAIVVSFSLMAAMAIMVASFRMSLDEWMHKILPADLYLRAGHVGQSAWFPPTVLDRLAATPGIERVEGGRFASVVLDARRPPLTLIARPIDPASADRALWMEREARAPMPGDSVAVWVSEAAADLFGLEPDTTFDLPLGSGRVTASVRGVYRDYEHREGALILDRDTYVRLSRDARVNALSLWVRSGHSVAQVQEAVRARLPDGVHYEMRTPAELRTLSLRVFDRTFAVTYLLELVAVLIGLFGIAASTSGQVLARRGEFGVLRHLGFTRRQVAATLAIEGAGAGLVGVIVGLASGGAVSLILIHVVNRQSFHWSMDLYVPVALLAVLSAALILSAAAVAVLSGRQAMSGDAVRAVKEDW